ncbi:penicillin-binding protein 2 [Leptolyngbya sp. FACHB-16]|nr:penicillin-binding protein 2 [Leptolyngbya sp. FACHB-8]MBD2153753.1 penicillin-binding protein 2 [Leptolyngbya sp. FACHB-16]
MGSSARPVKPSRSSALDHPRARLLIVWAILLVSMVGLAANLVRLQVFDAESLQAQAESQQSIMLNSPPPRRPIVDRLGNILAVDRPVYTLYAHPKLFKESKEAIAQALSPIINKPMSDLVQLFQSGESGLEAGYALPEDMADRIRDLRMDGLELIEEQQRLYPQQNLFGEIVGFVNGEQKGQAGIEYSFDEQLQLKPRKYELRRTAMGEILPGSDPGDLTHSDELSLHLTVDSRLQRLVRIALQNTIKSYGAKRGAVLVMDVRDGSLISLVTEPTFDPNQFYKSPADRYRNWAVSDLYEPGSTFKTVNVAIALESKAVKPSDSFVDEGQIIVGEWPIQNNDYSYAGARGPQTITQIIQNSSNVGMVRVMQQLKPNDYYGWLEKIGLGDVTGTDLPFETASTLKDKETFLSDPIEPATTAFGQGISLTPLQMVQLQSSIANGGMLVTPHVVTGLYDANNKLQWQPKLPAPRRVFSTATAQAVLKMMEAVVDDGTGKAAQIPGYRLAGKTGTAQKASASGGYDSSARITSFVSLFPSDAPRYSILVVVDEPQGDNAYGGTVAAPLAKTVIETMITTLGVPPSRPAELKASPAAEAATDSWDDTQTSDDTLDSQPTDAADDGLTQDTDDQGW